MALLKVFADDRGDPADPQHSMMSIAGYVAKPEEWGLFEFEWDATLKMHRVTLFAYEGMVESGRHLQGIERGCA
jgi:hypothetical protein